MQINLLTLGLLGRNGEDRCNDEMLSGGKVK